MMRLHYLQHVPFEGLAHIQTWADKGGHTVTSTRFFAGEKLPNVDAFDTLVVLGGPMGANDDAQVQWMWGEKQFLERSIRKDKKVLGVCLGAQLIASVLGAKVYRNREKEIGWYPVELVSPHARQSPLAVLPPKVTVFHWHGDTFDLPKGAAHLARSAACDLQAFSYGRRILGLQFHLEMGLSHIETLARYASADLTPGSFVMDTQEMFDMAPTHVPPLQASLIRFLDGFAAL